MPSLLDPSCELDRSQDVAWLRLLVAACQQNHQSPSAGRELDPQAGPPSDPELGNPMPHRANISRVSQRETSDPNEDSRLGLLVREASEPLRVAIRLANFDQIKSYPKRYAPSSRCFATMIESSTDGCICQVRTESDARIWRRHPPPPLPTPEFGASRFSEISRARWPHPREPISFAPREKTAPSPAAPPDGHRAPLTGESPPPNVSQVSAGGRGNR